MRDVWGPWDLTLIGLIIFTFHYYAKTAVVETTELLCENKYLPNNQVKKLLFYLQLKKKTFSCLVQVHSVLVHFFYIFIRKKRRVYFLPYFKKLKGNLRTSVAYILYSTSDTYYDE